MTIVFLGGESRGECLNPAFALQRHTAPTAGVMASRDIISSNCNFIVALCYSFQFIEGRDNGTADPYGASQPKKRKIKKAVTWAPPDELVKTVYIPKVKNTRKYIPTRKNKGKNKENRRRVLLRGVTSRMQSWESSSSCVYDGSFDLDDTLMEFISDALYAAMKERPHDPIKFVAEYLLHTYNFA
ncbi:UNVERIFIED_CONTAM: hypothetical protein NCL1_24079 [Trichonephila clavipes]